jgi:hypothetical protein
MKSEENAHDIAMRRRPLGESRSMAPGDVKVSRHSFTGQPGVCELACYLAGLVFRTEAAARLAGSRPGNLL